jgi:hypothetical protein
MDPFLRIGRRQFLRNSALGMGATPLIPVLTSAEPKRVAPASRATAATSNVVTMQATFDAKAPIWIVREPDSGFQQQLASRELARGLRNLGLARDPVQVFARQGQPPAAAIVFSLSTSRQSIWQASEHQFQRRYAAGDPL